jgi:hypothetical protein
VKLTPEEIYQLAERASHGRPSVLKAAGGSRSGKGEASGTETTAPIRGPDPSFKAIVERVTEALAAELDLPEFEKWAESYRQDPSRYDEELLGLWRDPL